MIVSNNYAVRGEGNMTAHVLSMPELKTRLNPQGASTHAIILPYHRQWSVTEPLAMCGGGGDAGLGGAGGASETRCCLLGPRKGKSNAAKS